MTVRTALTALVLCLPLQPLAAQDTVPPVEQGVRIGITYTPGLRPGLMVLGLVLVALGFVYNRFQERLREWL